MSGGDANRELYRQARNPQLDTPSWNGVTDRFRLQRCGPDGVLFIARLERLTRPGAVLIKRESSATRRADTAWTITPHGDICQVKMPGRNEICPCCGRKYKKCK